MTSRQTSALPPGLTDDDLPAWMRRTRREIDWAFVVMAVLIMIVMWPFIARPGLPYNVGTQIEVSRTVEMAEAIKGGVLYPRWASDFNYGYGSPLWNYLAPLPHYMASLHYVFVQSDPETSVKVVLVLGLGLNGLGMFSFVRRRWGTHAALLASTIYVYSPQLVLVKPYLESSSGLLLAMGCFWMALWALDRVMSGERGWDWLLAGSMVAGIWLSHTPFSGVLFLAVTGWVLWRAALESAARQRLGQGLLVLVLGTGLSAFYWLPALWEWSAVHWHPSMDSSIVPWHRLRSDELLALPEPVDLSAVNPPASAALGVTVWALALVGVAAVFVSDWRNTPADPRALPRGEALQARIVHLLRAVPAWQWESGYFLLLGGGLLLIVTPLAGPVWDVFPDWPTLYPRDLLPLIAACGAVVAGQIGSLLRYAESARRRTLVLVVCLAGVLGLALPTLPMAPWPHSHDAPALANVVRDEAHGYMVGSQVSGLLLPVDVTEPPPLSQALVASYQQGVIDKVARDRLPTAARVDAVEHGPQTERLLVKSVNPVEVILLAFYYPGWRAESNERELPIRAEPETGLIAIQVPAGQHEVMVRLGTTWPRTTAWILTGLALIITLAISVRIESHQGRIRSYESRWKFRTEAAPVGQGVLLIMVLIFGAGGALARLAPETLAVRSERGEVLAAKHPLPRALQGGIDLLAYDLEPGSKMRAGDEFTVTLYWRATRPDLPDYQSNLSLVAADDPERMFVLARHRHPGAIPSSRWSIWPLFDTYVRDSFFLEVDKSVPPGEYNIVIQLGRCTQSSLSPCESIEPLFVQDGRGSSLGQRIVLPGPVVVLP